MMTLNKFDLRCLDLSQNYIFAENVINRYGDHFVYFVINDVGDYCPTDYIEETWDQTVFDLLHSSKFSNVLYFKHRKNFNLERMTLSILS